MSPAVTAKRPERLVHSWLRRARLGLYSSAMAFPFTKRWRDERRQRRDAERELAGKAAKERDLKAVIAAATDEAAKAENILKKTAKNSAEWATRNQEWIVAKGKQQMAELELSSWKTNSTFKELQKTTKSLKEKTEKAIQDLDDARRRK